MKQITVLFNGKKQTTYLLDEPHVVIGRGRSAHIPLDGNPIVSRQHAVIRADGGFHVIEDLGGANGTFVNDAAVKSTRLHRGDRVTLGKHSLRYEDATTGAISLKGRTLSSGAEDDEATGAAPTVRESGGSAPQIGPSSPKPPWQKGPGLAVPRTGGAASSMQGQERTVSASKEELEHLIAQMRIKSGPHLSVPTDGGLTIVPLDSPPVLIGHTDDCLVRLPGNRWFGRVACSLENRKGQWWLHARSPFWNPVKVGASKVAKKRKLADGTVFQAGALKLRFSLGEQQ